VAVELLKDLKRLKNILFL